MRSFVLAVLIGLTSSVACAKRPMPESNLHIPPDQIVTGFYQAYLEPREEPLELESFRNMLTPDLLTAILNARKDGTLDFDPFTNSQEDMELANVELMGPPTGTEAFVLVNLKRRGSNDVQLVNMVEVKVVQLEKRWRIGDVSYGFSLLDFLKKSDQQYQ